MSVVARAWSGKRLALGTIVGVAALGAFVLASQAGETVALGDLPSRTHVHGLAVDRQDPSRLLIATHHGLFRAGPDGQAERVSVVQDFMGFSPDPGRDGRTLYASGHPAKGGNLGFIASTDGGGTWAQVSPGLGGPFDFHQMTVSPKDPKTIYGAFRGLQMSRDAGLTWTLVGPAPDGLIALAASATSADTLYAATENGLLVSKDAGKTWTSLIGGSAVSLVHVTPDATLYAFVIGRGLVRAGEGKLEFATLGDKAMPTLLHLASDPADPARLFASPARGAVLVSADGGKTWSPFGRKS